MKKNIKERKKKVILIGITGASASGKTRFINKIIELNKESEGTDANILILKMDDYYKDLSHLELKKRRQVNFDHPDSVDFNLFLKHVDDLVYEKKSIDKPIYDFSINTRIKNKTEKIDSADIIFVEGIFALYNDYLVSLYDYTIFIHTEPDICLSRRILRDINDRKRSVSFCIKQYLTRTRPMFYKYVYPTRRIADIIVPSTKNNDRAIDFIYKSINKRKRNIIDE